MDTQDNNTTLPVFSWCSTEVDHCSFSRRCFMTGEYCSKQESVQRERKECHRNNTIKAFVIMNFSNMSDVVYKWRLKSFIETLKKHIYFNEKRTRLYCIDTANLTDRVLDKLIEIEELQNKETMLKPNPSKTQDGDANMGEEGKKSDETLRKNLRDHFTKGSPDEHFPPVEKIDVVRADSNPSSNFVICNSVCQQLQIADLVIVDVSVQNANVFYELGMAVALGKMILPICYSESFYKMVPPLEDDKWKKLEDNREVEHHLDCFPWRRSLFEHFGMRFRDAYKNRRWTTEYLPFKRVTEQKYGFSDYKYVRFPYLDIATMRGESIVIGEKLYNKLRSSYNNSSYNENTLVIYTMDSILNESQAAQCIVNYYHAVVRQFKDEQCFCGERVGLLLQTNNISEDPKDGPEEIPLIYSAGEVIQIGMNQATYKAHMDMIKPDDFLVLHEAQKANGEEDPYESDEQHESDGQNESDEQRKEWRDNAVRSAKEFIRNRSIPIYPTDPVFVKRLMDGLHEDIFDDIKLDSTNYEGTSESQIEAEKFYCLYHVMLRTLKYTNEIVVDISKNSLQSLFWLGAAHGSDVNAITVRRQETEQDRKAKIEKSEKNQRYIFDVAGLWSAVFRSDDTEGFYDQLAKAQSGIEQSSRLVLKDLEEYSQQLKEHFWQPNPKQTSDEIKKLFKEKEKQEDIILESYYRNRFWKPMLKYNRLRIYLRHEEIVKAGEQSPSVLRWDVDASAVLTHYLSKKKVIGEYEIITLSKGTTSGKTYDPEAGEVNFICVGNETSPIHGMSSMPTYINGQLCPLGSLQKSNSVMSRISYCRNNVPDGEHGAKKPCQIALKGFSMSSSHAKKNTFLTHIPLVLCYPCIHNNCSNMVEHVRNTAQIYHSEKELPEQSICELGRELTHFQLAQLILWRDIPEKPSDQVKYRVTINGASGPATLALSTILVDDDLLDTNLIGFRKNTTNKAFLVNLQRSIRIQVIDKYLERLVDTFKTDFAGENKKLIEGKTQEQMSNYYRQVTESLRLYFSAVLYRYFLPFLSIEDIQRICNGMKMYISSLRAANRSPFDLEYPAGRFDSFASVMSKEAVNRIAELVPVVLREFLNSFRGVEAFYEVKVKSDFDQVRITEESQANNIDFRVIEGIRQSSKLRPKCLYVTQA